MSTTTQAPSADESALDDLVFQLGETDRDTLESGSRNQAILGWQQLAQRAVSAGDSPRGHFVLSVLHALGGDAPIHDRQQALEHSRLAAHLGHVGAMFDFARKAGIWDHEALALLTAARDAGCELNSFESDYRVCMKQLTPAERDAVMGHAASISESVRSKGLQFKEQ